MNCLTKEEFERWSKSPALVRQNSQIQSPLSSSLSFNEVIKSPEVEALNQQPAVSREKQGAGFQDSNNKALALMVQPSIDYGKFNSFITTFLLLLLFQFQFQLTCLGPEWGELHASGLSIAFY